MLLDMSSSSKRDRKVICDGRGPPTPVVVMDRVFRVESWKRERGRGPVTPPMYDTYNCLRDESPPSEAGRVPDNLFRLSRRNVRDVNWPR